MSTCVAKQYYIIYSRYTHTVAMTMWYTVWEDTIHSHMDVYVYIIHCLSQLNIHQWQMQYYVAAHQILPISQHETQWSNQKQQQDQILKTFWNTSKEALHCKWYYVQLVRESSVLSPIPMCHSPKPRPFSTHIATTWQGVTVGEIPRHCTPCNCLFPLATGQLT